MYLAAFGWDLESINSGDISPVEIMDMVFETIFVLDCIMRFFVDFYDKKSE